MSRRLRSVVLLSFALVPVAPRNATSSGDPTIAQVRAIVVEARRAVEGDSVARVRARWTRGTMGRGADGIVALGIATLARLTYEYDDADRRYRALIQSTSAPTSTVGLYARLGHGQSLATRYMRDSASTLLHGAIVLARAQGDSAGAVESLISLLRLTTRFVGRDSAARIVATAESLVRARDSALVASVRCVRGGLIGLANPARADSLLADGERIARAAGDRRELGRCLLARANAISNQGFQTRASDVAQSARRVLAAARDDDVLAAALQFEAFLGVTYGVSIVEARRIADSAITLGTRTRNPVVVAWTRLNYAQLALRLGDVRASARALAAARKDFATIGDRYGLATAWFQAADAAFTAGALDEAFGAYQTAESLHVALGIPNARPTAIIARARVARERGDLITAERLLNEAVRVAASMNMRGIAGADQFYERGLLALSRGQHAQAIRALETFADSIGREATHYQLDVQARLAETRAAMGQLDEAERILNEVSRNEAAVRRVRPERVAQVSLLEGRRFDFDTDLGLATIVARFGTAGRHEAALRVAEDRRARYLSTQMRRRRALGGDTTARYEVRVARLAPDEESLAGLATSLPDSTALLEYVTGRGGEPTTLIIVTRTAVTSVQLPPADSLIAPIERFVASIEGGGTARGVARQLGRVLLERGLSSLGAGITRLAIVADGPLHRVPFDALELGDGRPVLARYAVSHMPSARIAFRWWSSPGAARGTRVLAFGDATFAPASKLPRLPASASEARLAARSAPGGQVLLGARASEAALRRGDLRGVRVLHLATHAEVEDWGLLSSALTLAPGDGEDGRVGVEDIAALDLDADLVVLSGCRTAGGVVVAGEGLQGLVAPFLEAGSRSVVATLWPVADRPLARLMNAFYAQMRLGKTTGDALRAAKVTSMRAGDPPASWASLTLVGDATVRPLVPMSRAGATARSSHR